MTPHNEEAIRNMAEEITASSTLETKVMRELFIKSGKAVMENLDIDNDILRKIMRKTFHGDISYAEAKQQILNAIIIKPCTR